MIVGGLVLRRTIGRELTIDFSFLPVGSEWKASLFEDTADTYFETNPEAYNIRTMKIKAGDKITVKLAPGGGYALTLSK